jgi:hypothetical protein
VSGGIVGIVLVAALFAALGEPWFIIKAVFFGAPFGAALGAVIHARRASQKHRARSIRGDQPFNTQARLRKAPRW